MPDDNTQLVTSEKRGDVFLLSITTQQLRDSETSYALRDQMLELVSNDPPTKVAIDLEQVQFIGSLGFLAFLSLRRKLAEAKIVVCNLSDPIRDMFQACRLIPSQSFGESPFEMAADIEEAVRELGG